MYPGQRFSDHYALATDKVRYVGEPVVAVAAVDRYVAEDALELIDVQYHQIDAITTVDDAIADGAPKLYEEWPDNVSATTAIAKGEVDAAFDEADIVVGQTFYNARQSGVPLETRGVVATWNPVTDELDVWLGTQAPNLARDLFGELFGLTIDKIRVRVPDMGGGFGNKFDFYAEEVIAAILSRRTGRPVKIIEDRLESFVANAHAREQRIEMELAATNDGRITGLRARITGVLGGALATVGAGPVWATGALCSGPYDIANSLATISAVVTNKSPYGSYRGWGQPKANLIHERLVELLARRLGMPANKVRYKNFIAPEAFPYPSPLFYYDSGRYSDCLRLAEDAVAKAGWHQRQVDAASDGRSLGIGYGFHVEATGFGPSRVLNMVGLAHSGFDEEVVRIDSTGSVTVFTGQTAMGQGMATALAQVAADALDVPLEDVTVVSGDTQSCPFTGYGTGGSRAATVGGAAVLGAAGRLRQKVLAIASHMLKAPAEELVISNGVISVADSPTRSVSLAQVGDAAYRRLFEKLPEDIAPTLVEREVFDPPNVAFSYGCSAVLSEVDRETGVITLLDYRVRHDCGVVINPLIVDGQIHGGAAQAIGGALYEEIVYSADGQIQTTTFMDYLVPTASEIPEFVLEHQETPSGHIPGGFKGMGEAGTIGGGAAILSSIENALADLEITIDRIPITPPHLLGLIDAAADDARP
jgi:carbon-monoxide dehydrogenase large subunit